MKKIIFAMALGVSALSFTSCETCMTCTYTDPDMNTERDVVSDFCASGSTLEAQQSAHESNGYICVED